MKVSLFTLCVVACIGCTHKPFTLHQQVIVAPVGDTMHVSYQKDIKPVIQQNCYVCHATSVITNGGLDLENFQSFRNYLAYGFRGDGVYGSKFYHCISHSLLALPMPPTYVIDSCSLSEVKHWIDAGAPDN